MTIAPELLALSTSASVAASMMIASPIIARVGAIRYNATRLLAALAFLVSLCVARRLDIATLSLTAMSLLAVSSVLGIFIGDSAVYRCVRLCGVHLATLLYAVNVPLTLLLGAWVVGDVPLAAEAFGALMIVAGVVAVVYGAGGKAARGAATPAPSRAPTFAVGVAIGLLGALCQSTAVLLALPVMRGNLDPILASTFRAAVAVVVSVAFIAFRPMEQPAAAMSARDRALGSLSGVLGMGVGMTALLASLERGNAGLMSALASMAPVLVLAAQSLVHRRRPSVLATAGTLSVCTGIFVSLARPV